MSHRRWICIRTELIVMSFFLSHQIKMVLWEILVLWLYYFSTIEHTCIYVEIVKEPSDCFEVSLLYKRILLFQNRFTNSIVFVDESFSQHPAGLHPPTTRAWLLTVWDCCCVINHSVSFYHSLSGKEKHTIEISTEKSILAEWELHNTCVDWKCTQELLQPQVHFDGGKKMALYSKRQNVWIGTFPWCKQNFVMTKMYDQNVYLNTWFQFDYIDPLLLLPGSHFGCTPTVLSSLSTNIDCHLPVNMVNHTTISTVQWLGGFRSNYIIFSY